MFTNEPNDDINADNDAYNKSSNNYTCTTCNYNTSRKSQYLRHLTTSKHNLMSITVYVVKISFIDKVYLDTKKHALTQMKTQ